MRHGNRAKNAVFKRDHVTHVVLANYRCAIEHGLLKSMYLNLYLDLEIRLSRRFALIAILMV